MKFSQIITLIAVAFLFSGVVFTQSIQSGKFLVTQGSTPNYSLADGNGERTVPVTVTFDKPFLSIPQILIGVTSVDGARETNLRYDAIADAVTRDGFTIQLKTWADSKIFRIGGSWMAVDMTQQAPADQPAKKIKKGKK
ncbi:MAG: H-type lectin domain-containing protein [Bacteroidota bacterium]